GIPMQNGNVVRPLLGFSRARIMEYAVSLKLNWREDSSNASVKYLRNKIRHEITPLLETLQPNLLHALEKTQSHLQQTQTMAEDAAIMVYQRVAYQGENEIEFKLNELLKLPNHGAYLYQWLREFGFTQWDDIVDLTRGISGKQVHSQTHTILRDRDRLVLFEKKADTNTLVYSIESPEIAITFPVKLDFKKVESASQNSNTTIFVNADALSFPLEVRTWQQGDTFSPIGMDGKSKKLSKFLKDEKVALHDKLHVWVLVSQGDIVWVIGRRMDDRFKIQPTTTNILRITTE
ncbi:MAG: tRNA(Ile)-lysidine synthetase, partial [Chitinophagaceae bacterium]